MKILSLEIAFLAVCEYLQSLELFWLWTWWAYVKVKVVGCRLTVLVAPCAIHVPLCHLDFPGEAPPSPG